MSIQTSADRRQALQQKLDELAASLGVPGAVVGVVDGTDDLVCTTGLASVDDSAAVSRATLFAIGSTSKTVTGTVVMRLIQDGLLRLDTLVRDVLPDFRLADEEAAATLRIEHLLTHSGGFLGDADEVLGWGDDALERSIATFASLPQFFPPGFVASYSNAGIRLLGRIIAVVTGESFEAVVQRVVFDPLGMTESFYFPWDAMTRPHAVGHVVTDGTAAQARVLGLSRDMGPEGGVMSTVGDQLRYARFHLRGQRDAGTAGEAPVDEATRLLMQEPHRDFGPPLEAAGYPWLLTHHGDARIVKHGGNISDLQLSEFVLAPDLDLAVTVMTNSSAGKVLGAAIVAWVLEQYRGVVATPETVAWADGAALDAAVGVYDSGQWTNTVTRDDDEGLVITMRFRPDIEALGIPQPPPFAARLSADDRIIVDGGRAAGRLIRDDDGTVTFLHFGLRATVRR